MNTFPEDYRPLNPDIENASREDLLVYLKKARTERDVWKEIASGYRHPELFNKNKERA
jgi:hypothetical protein